MGLTRNPFTTWLAQLRRPSQKSPKRITDYQFYMQHDEFKDAVNAKFEEHHWDAKREDVLSLRCAVARELFNAEPEEIKVRIRKEAVAEHEGELQRWLDANEGLPAVEVEEQAEWVLYFLPKSCRRLNAADVPGIGRACRGS